MTVLSKHVCARNDIYLLREQCGVCLSHILAFANCCLHNHVDVAMSVWTNKHMSEYVGLHNTHIHTYIYIYICIDICICMHANNVNTYQHADYETCNRFHVFVLTICMNKHACAWWTSMHILREFGAQGFGAHMPRGNVWTWTHAHAWSMHRSVCIQDMHVLLLLSQFWICIILRWDRNAGSSLLIWFDRIIFQITISAITIAMQHIALDFCTQHIHQLDSAVHTHIWNVVFAHCECWWWQTINHKYFTLSLQHIHMCCMITFEQTIYANKTNAKQSSNTTNQFP